MTEFRHAICTHRLHAAAQAKNDVWPRKENNECECVCALACHALAHKIQRGGRSGGCAGKHTCRRVFSLTACTSECLL
jgi:hypothetical protein